jgi:hypothetical protein
MSYNSAIPQSSDARAQSQGQILANFQAINAVWANNHVPLNPLDNPVQGMHTVLTMRPESGDPTTTASQTALYNKLVSSVPELFFRPASNGTPIQMTYPSLSTTGLRQYSFVAGPFVVYGGFVNNPVSGVPITLTPSSTLLYVGLTPYGATGAPTVHLSLVPTSINTPVNSFTPKFQTGATIPIMYYLAIGM